MVTLDDDVRPNVVMCVSVHCVVTEAHTGSAPGLGLSLTAVVTLAWLGLHITSLGAAAGRAGHKLPSPRHWPPLAATGRGWGRTGPGAGLRHTWSLATGPRNNEGSFRQQPGMSCHWQIVHSGHSEPSSPTARRRESWS